MFGLVIAVFDLLLQILLVARPDCAHTKTFAAWMAIILACATVLAATLLL